MNINFEQVHNYFERIVFEEVARQVAEYPDYTGYRHAMCVTTWT